MADVIPNWDSKNLVIRDVRPMENISEMILVSFEWVIGNQKDLGLPRSQFSIKDN